MNVNITMEQPQNAGSVRLSQGNQEEARNKARNAEGGELWRFISIVFGGGTEIISIYPLFFVFQQGVRHNL